MPFSFTSLSTERQYFHSLLWYCKTTEQGTGTVGTFCFDLTLEYSNQIVFHSHFIYTSLLLCVFRVMLEGRN